MNNSANFTLPPELKISFIPWAFFNVLIIVCGGIGNMLVVLAYRNPRMKTVTNLFIANLAFADLNVVLINIPMNLLKLKLDSWPFGLVICKIVTSLLGITLAASVGSLIAIALDRYRAIVHPLKPRMRTRHAFYIIIAIWISAIVVVTPMLVFTKVINGSCEEDWPIGAIGWQTVYTYFIFVTMYILPLGTISGLYFMIYLNLMRKEPLQKSAHRARVSVVRMLIMVVVVFALCWLPFHGLLVFLDFSSLTSAKVYAFSFALWLTTANSSFNPIIYAVFNLNYRREFARILTCGTVNVGRYLGCDASIEDPRSHVSKTTVRKSPSLPMNLTSTVNGENTQLFTEDSKGNRIYCTVKKTEVNGNSYDKINGDSRLLQNKHDSEQDSESEDKEERCPPDCETDEIVTNPNA